MSNVILQINEITKIYRSKEGDVHALKGVTLDVFQGEILGLLGVNGAGKTTLSSIIATLHPPTSGTVLFKGRSIYDDLMEYRKKLGFCSQRPNLDKELTVEQNLLFSGRYYLMEEDDVQVRTKELLEHFNLAQFAKRSVSMLSGGYRQRLMIARALMHRPEILILDEPTVALDPGIRRQLWQTIKDLKAMGVTIILTTHYLEEAELLSDRVCILDKGKILLVDKPENLTQSYDKGNLEEVFLHLTEEESA